jgi:hypothetical protein
MDYSVFLSYRRSDTSGHAGRICDDLERHFNAPLVFRDIDAIGAGTDFVQALEQAIAAATVVVVLIGETWLSRVADDGLRRLDDPADHVRREVAMALQDAGSTVVPVLVDGAVMPAEEELPASLRRLARLQAIELSDSRWEYDMAHLVRVLETAGVRRSSVRRLAAWIAPLAGFSLVIVLAAVVWHLQGSTARIDRYTGLWHLPNGSFWTVREKDGALWMEETHYASRQVWKRGPGTLDDRGLAVQLELVFDSRPLRYQYSLRLSDDRQSLIGSVRRSDSVSESSLVLTRSEN